MVEDVKDNGVMGWSPYAGMLQVGPEFDTRWPQIPTDSLVDIPTIITVTHLHCTLADFRYSFQISHPVRVALTALQAG